LLAFQARSKKEVKVWGEKVNVNWMKKNPRGGIQQICPRKTRPKEHLPNDFGPGEAHGKRRERRARLGNGQRPMEKKIGHRGDPHCITWEKKLGVGQGGQKKEEITIPGKEWGGDKGIHAIFGGVGELKAVNAIREKEKL